MRSNCLFFALGRWWRHGGYVVVMQSNYGWWPHLVWSQDLITFEEFSPPCKVRRWCPPLVFAGTVRVHLIGQFVRVWWWGVVGLIAVLSAGCLLGAVITWWQGRNR